LAKIVHPAYPGVVFTDIGVVPALPGVVFVLIVFRNAPAPHGLVPPARSFSFKRICSLQVVRKCNAYNVFFWVNAFFQRYVGPCGQWFLFFSCLNV
jgi:hypothetical protein